MNDADLTGLDRRVLLIWGLRAAILAAIVALLVALVSRFLVSLPRPAPAAAGGAVFILGAGLVLARYRRWGYTIRDDALYLDRGVITRVRTVVPMVRIQHTDTQRRPLDRLVGLSRTVVYTAGSRGADVSIPGLAPDDATALQERLKELAAESAGDDAV